MWMCGFVNWYLAEITELLGLVRNMTLVPVLHCECHEGGAKIIDLLQHCKFLTKFLDNSSIDIFCNDHDAHGWRLYHMNKVELKHFLVTCLLLLQRVLLFLSKHADHM